MQRNQVCLLLFVVCAAWMLSSCQAKSCNGDIDCEEDEACLKFTVLIKKCKPRKKEGERCVVHPLRDPLNPELYLVSTPCLEDLKCVQREGLTGTLVGKCEVDSEVPPNAK